MLAYFSWVRKFWRDRRSLKRTSQIVIKRMDPHVLFELNIIDDFSLRIFSNKEDGGELFYVIPIFSHDFIYYQESCLLPP
jgi:hypothetical protein